MKVVYSNFGLLDSCGNALISTVGPCIYYAASDMEVLKLDEIIVVTKSGKIIPLWANTIRLVRRGPCHTAAFTSKKSLDAHIKDYEMIE